MNAFELHHHAAPRVHHVSPLLMDAPYRPGPWRVPEDPAGERVLTIRAADDDGHRSSAHILVSRMYAARGYHTPAAPDASNPYRLTLVAIQQDETVGTITVGFDQPDDGLLVQESFPEEVERLRAGGARLCEFIKLAIDGVQRSKKVLASLMHAALICARQFKSCDRVLIEVNPRHVRFYQEMLGFEVLVHDGWNHRVDAPAVLMTLDLGFADQQLDAAQGRRPGRPHLRRSLYSHGFSRQELTGVINRMRISSA